LILFCQSVHNIALINNSVNCGLVVNPANNHAAIAKRK